MRLYCEVDVPFDKRSSRNKSSHTLLQRKKKDFILDLGENPSIDPGTSRLFFITFDGEPGLRYRYLSTFLSHLVENPGMNLGTSRLFVFTSGGEPGHRSLYLSTFFFVTSGGEPGTSRLSCHKYVVMPMNIQTTDSIIIKCNVFLQGK